MDDSNIAFDEHGLVLTAIAIGLALLPSGQTLQAVAAPAEDSPPEEAAFLEQAA